MNRTTPLLSFLVAAAVTFNAPAMNEYRDLWNNSDQTEEDAEIVAFFIKDRFASIRETDHAGMADLLGVPCVTYKTPSILSQVTHSKSTR